MAGSERLGNLLRKPAVMLAMGLSAAFGTVGAAYHHFEDESGQSINLAPLATPPQEVSSGGSLQIDFWNIEDQASASKQLRYLDGDVDLLAEVTPVTAGKIYRRLRTYDEEYVMADRLQNFQEGGHGDAILIKGQIPLSFKFGIMPGTTSLFSDAFKLVTGRRDFDDFWQEKRAIMAEKIVVTSLGSPKVLELLDTHITGTDGLHAKQLAEVIDFTARNTTPDQLAVECGDYNDEDANSVSRKFAKIGYTMLAKHGSSNHTSGNGDYCFIHNAGQSIGANLSVITRIGGRALHDEHFPLQLTLTALPAQKLS